MPSDTRAGIPEIAGSIGGCPSIFSIFVFQLLVKLWKCVPIVGRCQSETIHSTERKVMAIGRDHVGSQRWRWRLPPHQRMAFRFTLACATLACALLLLALPHLVLRAQEPKYPPWRGDRQGSRNLRSSARASETASLARDPIARSDVVVLRNGVLIPRLGFGTAGLGEMTESATSWALEAGYRLIDSAQATEWYNEKAVGRAIRFSNIRRDELFLVSKLHPRHLGYEVTKQQFSTSLQDLGTSYVDLFLLHYPRCFSTICSDVTPTGSWQESWKALEELHDELKVRAIGVSNFNKEELKELVAYARIKPLVVQRNSDPFSPDVDIQEYCEREAIQYMGYSTLGSQWLMRGCSTNPVLNDPIVRGIAVAQGCTSAQVVLSWALQNNQVVVPRSSNRLRIVENLEAPHCNLSRTQVTRIDNMYRHLPRLSADVR